METNYRCTECGAQDRDHQDYTDPPPALICFNSSCRAGYGMKLQEQLRAQIGMFPIKEEIN